MPKLGCWHTYTQMNINTYIHTLDIVNKFRIFQSLWALGILYFCMYILLISKNRPIFSLCYTFLMGLCFVSGFYLLSPIICSDKGCHIGSLGKGICNSIYSAFKIFRGRSEMWKGPQQKWHNNKSWRLQLPSPVSKTPRGAFCPRQYLIG